MAQELTQPPTQMSTKNIFWGVKGAVRQLSWNLETSGSVQVCNGIALSWLCFGIKLFIVYSAKPYIVCCNLYKGLVEQNNQLDAPMNCKIYCLVLHMLLNMFRASQRPSPGAR
jgi:hypothetical protein